VENQVAGVDESGGLGPLRVLPMSSACLLRLAGFGHGNGDRLLPATHLLARAAFQRALLMFVHHLVDLLLLRRCRRALPGMLAQIEADLKTAGPDKMWRLRQRAELIRELLASSGSLSPL
jgi:hypothetical protein